MPLQVKRGELDSHLNDQSKHLRSMYTEMQQLKDDIRRKDSAIESLEKKVTFIESLKKEMAAMQRQLDEVKNGTTTGKLLVARQPRIDQGHKHDPVTCSKKLYWFCLIILPFSYYLSYNVQQGRIAI